MDVHYMSLAHHSHTMYSHKDIHMFSARNTEQLAIGHFLTNFNIWPTIIYFGWPNFLYIFNGQQLHNNLKISCL